MTIRRVAAKVDVPNAIDFFGIPDDSFQTEDNTYIGATLQNQTTSHWHNLLRYGATRQNSEFVNPSPTGIPFDPFPVDSANFLGKMSRFGAQTDSARPARPFSISSATIPSGSLS